MEWFLYTRGTENQIFNIKVYSITSLYLLLVEGIFALPYRSHGKGIHKEHWFYHSVIIPYLMPKVALVQFLF